MYKDCQKESMFFVMSSWNNHLSVHRLKPVPKGGGVQGGACAPPFQGLTQMSKSHAKVFQLIEQ